LTLAWVILHDVLVLGAEHLTADATTLDQPALGFEPLKRE